MFEEYKNVDFHKNKAHLLAIRNICCLMETIKRTSYPSKQLRAGPAPLASFEDLPSDELESPEGLDFHKDNISSDLNNQGIRSLQQKFSGENNDCLTTETLDTLTLSALSTPQIESDFDSHFTITPGEYFKSHSSGEFRTASLSSLTKEDGQYSIKQKKGSAVSLSACETSQPAYQQRKSSWTDLFRSHNQNSRSTQKSQQNFPIGEKISKTRHKSEQTERNQSDPKLKEKGTFLSIFKVGKKSAKNICSPLSSDVSVTFTENSKNISKYLPNTTCNESVDKIISLQETNSSCDIEEKQSRHPKLIEKSLGSKQPKQFPIDRVSSEINKLSSNFDENGKNLQDKSTSDEENFPSSQIVTNKESNSAFNIIDDDHESSESELAFDIKESLLEKKDEDDFEAEKLVAQDLSEIEEYSAMEFEPVVIQTSRQTVRTSRQQRLEVTTIPIERPRSTTPINIAPLEAFIQSVSPSSDTKVEKIKLSLPGDQFASLLKSPKKGSSKSWMDFCEEGLHSPRLHKRSDGDELDINLKTKDFIAETCDQSTHCKKEFIDERSEGLENQWVTFEENFEKLMKLDASKECAQLKIKSDLYLKDIDTNSKKNEINHEPHQNKKLDKKFAKCSCECHVYGCDCSFIMLNAVSEDSPDYILPVVISSKLQSGVFSANCQCHCHQKYTHFWDPVKNSEVEVSNNDEKLKHFGLSSESTFCSMESKEF